MRISYCREANRITPSIYRERRPLPQGQDSCDVEPRLV